MRLTASVVIGLLITLVLVRLQVMPLFGLETPFQRVIEACSGLGLLAAALAFDRGDPPRRPWATLTAALLMVPLARAALAYGVELGEAQLGHVLLILSNILCITALLGFRSMLISTGLTPEWTSGARIRAAFLLGLVVVAGSSLLSYHLSELGDLSAMGTGEYLSSIVTIISIVADGVILGVGLLLIRLVQPMMGGSVALPYILVAVGGGIFLFVDLFSVLLKVTTQDQFTDAPVPIALATLGWSAFALAGLSQRQLVRRSR